MDSVNLLFLIVIVFLLFLIKLIFKYFDNLSEDINDLQDSITRLEEEIKNMGR